MSITYYNSKHDISYSKFNASNIPWNINTSYIYQNNLNTRNVSQYFQNINNNLLFESSTNNIIFITPQNKNVIVKNNMVIHNNLDISNNLNTSLTRANDISVNNVLYFSDISPNVVGTLKVQGGIFINSNKEDKEASRTRFTGIVLYGTVIIFDCSIVDCDNIITTDISDSSIINSYIYNTPIGYDKYNNIYPNNAIFSDVILNNLIFDSSLNNNRLSFIRFNNNSNSNSITISSSNDFSNLEISKPLLVEQQETNTNIINVSNISIFNGDISCNTLYYSRLNPDIRLNTYFDVSVSAFSLSGSIIPTRSTNIDLGSNTSKFRNIHSDKFTGVLDGSSTIALNLVPNLSMSFNDLNITGALTLNGLNLNQNLITNFVTISNVNISFGTITSNISDLSLNLNSRITILRNNITLSFGDVSSNIRTICGTLISISNDIFYTKTGFDTSLNRNFIKNTDLSTAIMVNPDAIYGSIGYLDNALNKQISVTLSNELLFPYAITYIDDNVEDTNIKERYKIKQTMTKSTTTLTTAYTVKTIRTFKTTTNYNNVPAEPDNANHKYLVMANIGNGVTALSNKWYDVAGTVTLPAVFKKTVDAAPIRIVTSFELKTNKDTWTNHRDAAHILTTTNVKYSLAIITTQEDNDKIKDLLPVNSAAWIGAQRIKPFQFSEGGTKTTNGSYIIHSFGNTGSNILKINADITVDYLIVAGGGSGGAGRGGGGGAGGVKSGRLQLLAGSYNITVGAGGARASANLPGNDGISSSIGLIGTGNIGNWSLGRPPQANTWNSVCWSPQRNIFVAVSTTGNNRVMYSYNGIAWFLASSPAAYSWYSVAWSPQLLRFVAIAIYQTNGVMYSSDGIIWTLGTAPYGEWRRVCWSPKRLKFVAVGKAAFTVVKAMTSTDGITWNNSSTNTPGYDWLGVCWAEEAENGNGIFVAVTDQSKVMTSSDGVDWELQTNVPSGIWWNVCWSPQLLRFVAVGTGGTNNVMYSSDGKNWTPASGPVGCNDVCWSPEAGAFVALAFNGKKMTSKTGISLSWTEMGSYTGSTTDGLSLVWSPGVNRFVAVGSNAVMSALLSTLITTTGGGGGGGSSIQNGRAGGSGGGASGGNSLAGGSGTTGEGNAGYGRYSYYIGGGGGGAGAAAGADAATLGKNGAIGISNELTGIKKYYAGGGGGGGDVGTAGIASGGAYKDRNGLYGGGNGSLYDDITADTYTWTDIPWTNDTSIGLSPTSSYTVAVNLGNASTAVTVGGVSFQTGVPSQAYLNGPTIVTGTNFSITTIGSIASSQVFTVRVADISATGNALATQFIYSESSQPITITLSNLIYGATYKTSIFSVGTSTARSQTFIANGGIQAIIDPGIYGTNKGIIINITFIADNTGSQIISITKVTSNFTFHMYALTNRLVSATSLPFAAYTDAVANTGGGGGGTDPGYGLPSGAGGSGIVIIRHTQTVEGAWPGRGSEYWEWSDRTPWDNYINWASAEPGLDEIYAKIQKDGFWHDVNSNHNEIAVYMRTETFPATNALTTYELDSTPRTWEGHNSYASTSSGNGTTYKLACATDSIAAGLIVAAAGNVTQIYIGGRRKANSNNATGRTDATWEWVDGSVWNNNNHNFYDGDSSISSYTTTYTQGSLGAQVNTTDLNGISAVSTSTPVETYSDITQTNVKLPRLVSSSNGSIVVTSTAIGVNSRPTPPSNERSPLNSNTPVSGFRPIDPNVIGTIGTIGAIVDGQVVNTIILNSYTRSITGATRIDNTDVYRLPSTTLDYATDTQDIYEYKRFIKHTYDTYVYRNDYYDTDNGLTAGSFKISDNSSNYSYYRTAAIAPPAAISTAAYVCIAITNDGMFVAIGKAYDVTVYMKVSNGWSSLGYIGVDFSTYINSNMIPTQLPPDFRKNIQNLAINYIAPTLFIAYGDNKTSIKVYRYTIAGQSWTPIGQAHIHNPTTNQLSNPNNFGYFVVLSFSPSILGFTVDDKFHTYNCSGASDNSIRGSSQTLTQPSTEPSTYNVDRNIIAFKISSDADKIIVSNTYYVFIYKWNITRGDWDVAKYIDYARDVITFDYGAFNSIIATPRSLDISNISSNECVFAVGFPDKHIYSPKGTSSTPATPSRARGYVEYWKLSNTTLTKLAILFPRMRDITTNTPGDIDEYFFSAGGIKITNSNTILVAPNYKFHFNSTNKSYYMSGITATQQYHFDTGNNLAAIENEVENELIRVSAINHSNTSYYTGGKWTGSNWSWWTRESPSPFIWNFEAWDNYQPQFTSSAAVEVNTLSRRWNSLNNLEQRYAMYMTIMPSYSLNTFSIFNNKFFFHSSGFYSSYSTTNQFNTTIASWRISTESESIRFRANGDVQQSTNSRTTMSDIKLKENIVDTRPKLQDLLKIRVVNYNLKGTKGNKLIGVVAQELEDIFPLLVGKQELSQEDIKLGKTETYKYVKYSCFDVMLIKAIQEQQAIITNLTSQLDLIDNKCKILKTIAQDVVILNQDRDFLICENELLKISINKILELMKKGTK